LGPPLSTLRRVQHEHASGTVRRVQVARSLEGRHTGLRIIVAIVVGLTIFSVLAIPADVAQAATEVVTNCSGSSSTVGSLPYEVGNAASGDTITFALSAAVVFGTYGAIVEWMI